MTSTICANAALPETWWSGRCITHYEVEHTWVALRFAEDVFALCSASEASAGKWFEVFPLMVETSLPDYLRAYAFKWVALSTPLQIARAASLWREEWLESAADSSQCMGSGPHFVQHVARTGGAPAGAHAVAVHAGIAFESVHGARLVICSSDNTPFKVDCATEQADIQNILRFHTMR